MNDRADLEVETLLTIILVLVAVWIAVEVVTEILGTLAWLLGPFRPLFGLVIIALVVLWLLDRI